MKILRIEELTGGIQMGELTPEQLKEAYRLLRESFTAADLAEHLQPIADPVSADDVLTDMEDQQRKLDAQGSTS
jgi:phage gp37-like protein